MEEGKGNKRIWKISLVIFVLCCIIFVLTIPKVNTKEEVVKKIKIGITGYDKNDTFVSFIMKGIETEAASYSSLNKGSNPVTVNIVYAEKNQMKQNAQVEKFISLGYDIICVNLVDRTSASEIVDKVETAGIPLIFFNREPVEDDIYRGEKVYYVGTDAKETARLQGMLIADKYHEDPLQIDKNGNGIIEYVMLEGESGHQDAFIRTEYSIKVLKEQGISVEKLDSGTANWDRSEAAAMMTSWIETYGDSIELVICNNDDMALGVIDVFKSGNIKDVKVVGIDGTDPALNEVKYGYMLGTVSCESNLQGQAIFKLAVDLINNHTPSEELINEGERYIRVDLKTIKSDK
ncbi:MAG TPA: galactose ABC transporter substrate-binding protein [Candidatus Merdenecus merdavium]|nr:galactose ABC transporter substrate-binding protein [Candidatus Merdenecus merdavium]